ncbi:MAG: ABC transporter ATP-binding protein [Planctomycetota bacterium]
MSIETSSDCGLALEVRDVTHRYDQKVVLDGVSFGVSPGEWVVLFGESGSGKSTLLRVIAGIERPERGSIAMLSSDQTQRPAHQRPVAWMPQSGGCYEHLSIDENLAIAQQLIPDRVRDEGVDVAAWRTELVECLGLGPLLRRKPSAVSGGERQRAAIARALLTLRPILLLDEPLAHLNESMRERLGERIREWTRRLGMAVVYVTHDSLEAAQLADRMVILIAGKIEQIDAPKSIVARPASDRVADLVVRLRRFGDFGASR